MVGETISVESNRILPNTCGRGDCYKIASLDISQASEESVPMRRQNHISVLSRKRGSVEMPYTVIENG